ncbi:hypothetical protein HH682_00265 [Rosenbergiella sp. S61]|uniref:Uncharacterized protein n=1 Tax=Rosenbergiella gaditana TaxID=2726987 RepID=A0ABS5STY5_9GAMM|nr:hypothetical protein [Rosenbergiella gaditana]MBT0722898.1 hypothetical protein [Rosenbergiella gaditana]
MVVLPEVQQSLDLLDKIQHAVAVKDFVALLPMTEAYSQSIMQLGKIENEGVVKQLLAAQDSVETSLHQLQRDVKTRIEQVTEDKISHAYHAG